MFSGSPSLTLLDLMDPLDEAPLACDACAGSAAVLGGAVVGAIVV